MAKLIAFSGGSYSGKTSMIDSLLSNAEAKDPKLSTFNLSTIDENIRKHLGKDTIDDVRNDASKYLRLQIKAISTKAFTEVKHKLLSDGIYLVDRSLADSFYYLDTFVNEKKLNTFERAAYKGFKAITKVAMKFAMNHVYDKVMFFNPLPASECNDIKYRPMDLDNRKEARGIKAIYESIGHSVIPIDVTKQKSVSRALRLAGLIK